MPDEVGGGFCVIELIGGSEEILAIWYQKIGILSELKDLLCGEARIGDIHRALKVANVIILNTALDIGNALIDDDRHAERGGLGDRICAALADVEVGCGDILNDLVGKAEHDQLNVLVGTKIGYLL